MDWDTGSALDQLTDVLRAGTSFAGEFEQSCDASTATCALKEVMMGDG